MKKLICMAITVVLLTGCTAKPVVQAPSSPPVPTQPAGAQAQAVPTPTPAEEDNAADNRFDARQAKAGDLVAGLRIDSVEVPSGEEEDYDANVDFSGEVTVSGTYTCNKEDPFLENEISFKVDDASAAKLPKLSHDQRDIWFTFVNKDEAAEALGEPGSEGTATVRIRNYSIHYAHTEVWDTAELVEVVSK